jgi:hypothetical protein
MLWDVFISHASEDKDMVARPLARQLEAFGLRVWFDETQLRVGDSLRAKIDEGLAQSRFGVVIVSPAFFNKPWTQTELNGLFARLDEKVIIPIWHGVSADVVKAASPLLASIVAASTASGIGAVSEKILATAAPYLRPTQMQPSRAYSTQMDFPSDAVRRAVEVLESIAEPATWRHLDRDHRARLSSGRLDGFGFSDTHRDFVWFCGSTLCSSSSFLRCSAKSGSPR